MNTQINPMMYGAKGDCTTDDHNAIVAAMAAAQALAVGNASPAVVYFPKPPGGCYLTSTIQYTGVPFVGQPAGDGTSTVQYGVVIKGMPGYDVLHVPDPSQGSFTWNISWYIRDISFEVDDSVVPTTTTVPNLLHRWAGRWFDDGAMTASSAVFTSTSGDIGCSDVGQQILVGGAGATVTTTTLAAAISTTTQSSIQIAGTTSGSWPTIFGYLKVDSEILMYVGTQTNGISTITVLRGQAGTTAATHSNGATVTVMGNLATTISAVDPCWGVGDGGAQTWKVVTLAASATTTVSSAHAYISILDLPVATNIGNCSIAFDNLDALTTDWPNPSQTYGSNHSKLLNVNFNSTNGAVAASNHCGLFTQGVWNSLNSHHSDHVNFYALDYGLVEAPSEINAFYSTGGDFQHWDHMQFFVDRAPWITYNGGEGEMDHVQFTTLSGPQFMQSANNFADVPSWKINIQEMETWGMSADTRFGLRTEGSGFHIDAEVGISADDNSAGWIDSSFTVCNCFIASAAPIHLFGIGTNLTGSTATATIDNQGKGNSAWGYNNGASYPGGVPYPSSLTLIPQKGIPNMIGGIEPDFAADGYPATPYRHEDLFLTPGDMFVGTAGVDRWSSLYQADTASLTGGELFIHTGSNLTTFQPFYESNPTNHGLTIGYNFPATKGTLYVSLKCATATATTVSINTSGGTNNQQAITCSTSTLQTFAVPFDFTSATGNVGIKNNGTSGQDFWLAWAYIDIAPQLPAGTTIGGATPAIGPGSGTANGDVACYANTTGTMQDCNSTSTQTISQSGTETFNVASTGGSASFALKGSASANTFYQWYQGSTKLWQMGTTLSTQLSLFDSVNGHAVVNFPSNTMPANSIGGNAQGATLNGMNPVLTLPVGTPTYTPGTNVTSVACAAGYTCTNTRGELTIVGGTATTGTIATVNFSAALGAAPGLCMVSQNGGATAFNLGHGTASTSSFTITAGISVASSTVTADYECIP